MRITNAQLKKYAELEAKAKKLNAEFEKFKESIKATVMAAPGGVAETQEFVVKVVATESERVVSKEKLFEALGEDKARAKGLVAIVTSRSLKVERKVS